MKAILLGLASFLAVARADSHLPPHACMTAPVIPLRPGTVVSARLDSTGGKRCEASLAFNNSDFFPVRFDLKFLKCQGLQLAEFVVPREVPNGEAHVLWRCANRHPVICNRAVISGGLSDAEAINYTQTGTINCVFPVSTLTSLSTLVGSSTTLFVPVVTTIFSTGTNPPRAGLPTHTPSTEPSPAELLIPTGATTLVTVTSDSSKTITSSVTSPLFSTSTVPNQEPGSITEIIPVQTATIFSTSTDSSTTVVNAQITTILSTKIRNEQEATPALPVVTVTKPC